MSEETPKSALSLDGVLAEIDRLLREDLDVGRKMQDVEQAQSVRMRYLAQRTREETKPFEAQLTPLREHHARLRNAILALWVQAFDAETTLNLPSGKVSRRNYREVTVQNKTALLDELDRLDRLDLVDYTFDQKGLLQLLDKGVLKPREGLLKVHGCFNLQYRPGKESDEGI
jgi:hypothetical protein